MAHAVQSIASNCSELQPRALQRATLSELNHTLAKWAWQCMRRSSIFPMGQHACIVVFRCHILPLCAFLSPAASPCFSQWEALINQRTNCICIKSHSHTDRTTANNLDFHYAGFLSFHHTSLVATLSSLLANERSCKATGYKL